MFKCLNCGHLFDAGEQAVVHDNHGFRFGPAEEYSACPVCGGTDLETTVRCRRCGGEYLPSEMHGSICDQCVEDYVNYDSFLKFATSSKYKDEIDDLELFVFGEVFGIKKEDFPRASSFEMKQYLQEIYRQEVSGEKLLGTHMFLDKINHYMSDWSNKDYFAEWMEERMNKRVH